MDVVLDLCNIFKGNYFMERKLLILRDYVKQHKDSKIIIPEVSVEEIIKNYNHELSSAKKAISEYNSLLNLEPELVLDVSKLKEKYLSFIDFLRKDPFIEFVPYSDVLLSDIVKKSIYRIKPITGDKKAYGFCDAIIWRSVINWAKKNRKSFFAMISNDQEAFGDDLKGLHNELIAEAEGVGITVHLYNNLDLFIKDKSNLLSKNTSSELLKSFSGKEEYDFFDNNTYIMSCAKDICDLYYSINKGELFLQGVSLVRPETPQHIHVKESKVFESQDGHTQVHSLYEVNFYFVLYRDIDGNRIERGFNAKATIVVSFLVKNNKLIKPNIESISFSR